MKKIMVGMFLLLFVSIAGCSHSPSSLFGSHAVIDWIDFIKLNGHSYEGIYTGALSDPTLVGKEIGTVKFKVDDNVTNPNYKTKDGDAAFLEKGTKIFEVKGDPNLVVVKDKDEIGGYRVYYRDKGKYAYHFKDLNQSKIEKIQIYEEHYGSTKLDHQLLSTLTDPSEIIAFLELINQGVKNDNFQHDPTLPGQRDFAIVLYTNGAVAYRNNIFYNGKDYGWAPWSQEVLPESIAGFLNAKHVK
ncbi:hypothetical protein J1P26_14800 [Neobacillus sp. MM2021_6]|uniref:hypothetical protein n=1 Tax=Bacillaceae TaxID=186817 RepID=UPI001407D7AC|nr:MULTISPECIES: hypothetical protein [Bacillaceae]MBO0960967.1 hypothetical protein [Neobacillus sp. MM2021_6]NHC19121.1 hypothetical protein [Bacillus sp. MM2020_4]